MAWLADPDAAPAERVRPMPTPGGGGMEALADRLCHGGPTVLAAPTAGDAPLIALARALRVPVVALPPDPAVAAWCAAVAADCMATGDGDGRAAEVLASCAARTAHAGRVRPTVRRSVVRRWAARAWRPCPACAGGGVAGGACARCATPIARDPG